VRGQVQFAYDPARPLLEGITYVRACVRVFDCDRLRFEVPAGKSVAIVGHTGSGDAVVFAVID
jgi:ABC-type multidrug transport system fused ATPase/permease subunit